MNDTHAAAHDFSYLSGGYNLVTGHNLLAEAYIVYFSENSNLAAVFFRLQHSNAANLSHSLNQQNAGHNRFIRKMT